MTSKIKKNGLKINFKPMTGRDVLVDLVERTVVILIYQVSSQVLCMCVSWPIAAVIEIFAQGLLVSFFCFEYKTAAAGIDTPTCLNIFEKQWAYFFGFGFPFAATQFYFKAIGSSIFFVFFPLLVIISLDENGMGLLIKDVNGARTTDFCLPIFTYALLAKKKLLGNS